MVDIEPIYLVGIIVFFTVVGGALLYYFSD
jgi:hypothetical protein